MNPHETYRDWLAARLRAADAVAKPAEHQHKFLPSKRCLWRCKCGATFVSCLCGKCPRPS